MGSEPCHADYADSTAPKGELPSYKDSMVEIEDGKL